MPTSRAKIRLRSLCLSLLVASVVVTGHHPAAAAADEPAEDGVGSIGDLVWFDDNDNGRVDSGEEGVGGVRIVLFRDSDDDGIPDRSGRVDDTTTDGDGHYRFEDLGTGTYRVVLPASNWTTGPLRGCVSSNPTNPYPTDGVDGDDNGVPRRGVIATGPIVVDGGADASIDIGCHRPDIRLALAAGAVEDFGDGPGRLVTIAAELANVGAVAVHAPQLSVSGSGFVVDDKDWQPDGPLWSTTWPDTLHPGATVELFVDIRPSGNSESRVQIAVTDAETSLIAPDGRTLAPAGVAPAEVVIEPPARPLGASPTPSVEGAVAVRRPDPPASPSLPPVLALTGVSHTRGVGLALVSIVVGWSLCRLGAQPAAATRRRRSSP